MLDLDETLITTTYCSYHQRKKSKENFNKKPKNIYKIEIPNGYVMTQISVVLRPGV